MLFETSWEVCNKVGGIYTVLSSKAKVLKSKFGDGLVFVGPDIWTKENASPYFEEDDSILGGIVARVSLPFDLKIRSGRWNIPGNPQVILVDFKGVYAHLDDIFGEMWNNFGVDSLHAYGDYAEGCAFAVASATVMSAVVDCLNVDHKVVSAHFNEWTTGMGLLYLRMLKPQIATLFTTHATSIGRSICSNGKPLYDYFNGYNGDQMACELNMESKHSLEKTAAAQADCFTTVSEVTARECRQLLEVNPQVITPNGFEPDFVPGEMAIKSVRKNARNVLLGIAEAMTGTVYDDKNTFIVATSGRHEYRNKGIDLFIDAVSRLRYSEYIAKKKIIAFILVPGWVKEPSEIFCPNYITHKLNNEWEDQICRRLSQEPSDGNVKIIYVPCYLDGHDGVINLPYYSVLPGLDLTVFPSYYEPWGYTPLESIAFGVPTVTTDKSGFGQWIISRGDNSILRSGVAVVERNDSNYDSVADSIATCISDVEKLTSRSVLSVKKKAQTTASLADWSLFMKYYDEAFRVAAERRNIRLSEK
jgi:glycosyltransferase involved in cell wall biosynthesis